MQRLSAIDDPPPQQKIQDDAQQHVAFESIIEAQIRTARGDP